MSLRDVIKELQEVYQVTDAELARETGTPQATIYRLVSGMTDDPKISSLKPLANYFNITIGQLMGDEPLPASLKIHSAGQNKWNYQLPIISWEQACLWEQVVSKLTYANWSDWCATNFPVSASAYALLIKTNNFIAPFTKNAAILIEPNLAPEEGDFVAVHFSDMNTISIRQWLTDAGEIWLAPVQPSLPAVKWQATDHLCGVIIQTYLQLREPII